MQCDLLCDEEANSGVADSELKSSIGESPSFQT